MQKWEYRTVTFFASSQGAAPQVVTIDDKQLDGWVEGKTPTRAEYLNALGEEGWELFFYEHSVAIFKRPKRTGSDEQVTYAPSPWK